MIESAHLNLTNSFLPKARPQLFRRWIVLYTGEITIQWITLLGFVLLIHWIVIYPVDSTIQLLINRILLWKTLFYQLQYKSYWILSGFHCTFFSIFIFWFSRILQTYLYTKDTDLLQRCLFNHQNIYRELNLLLTLMQIFYQYLSQCNEYGDVW